MPGCSETNLAAVTIPNVAMSAVRTLQAIWFMQYDYNYQYLKVQRNVLCEEGSTYLKCSGCSGLRTIYTANVAETKLLKLVDSLRYVFVNTKNTDKGKWGCLLIKLHNAAGV
jgi:hypothetical protein